MPSKYPYKERKKLSTEYKNSTKHGIYFVTLVCQSRNRTLSNIETGDVILSSVGQIVESYWLMIPSKFCDVELGEFILMPNHFHGILKINPKPESNTVSLGQIIHWFKTWTTNEYHKYGNRTGQINLGKLWQRGYNESRIPRGSALNLAGKYIRENKDHA